MSTSSKARNRRRAQKKRNAWRGERGYIWYDDPRREKRNARKQGALDPVYQAYCEGEALACLGPRNMPKRLWENPYPPGKRHDAWQEGFDKADPMGEHHGRNE